MLAILEHVECRIGVEVENYVIELIITKNRKSESRRSPYRPLRQLEVVAENQCYHRTLLKQLDEEDPQC
jgi:hypothetical protein